jgi:phosphoserine phosphatase RsbU/P
MGIQVTDLSLLRDQLLLRREKLETAAVKAQAANLVQLLDEVDRALERIDVGSFGICEACHGTVEARRLIADPLTRICLDCLKPEQARALEQDLELAARIQAGLLPKQDFAAPGWKVCYHYQPAGMVSGDYCDLVHDGRYLYFMVGDVSGKGVAASMLMANLHAMFRALIPAGLPLAQLVERANRIFCESTLPTQYATLIVGRADDFGTVEICNGGHMPPLHVGPAGVRVVETSGLPVGLFCDQKFSTSKLEVMPGDTLVMYTDGVSEAENGDGVQYGHNGLGKLLGAHHKLGPQEIVKRCTEEVLEFRRGLPSSDDQTILALQFSPGLQA